MTNDTAKPVRPEGWYWVKCKNLDWKPVKLTGYGWLLGFEEVEEVGEPITRSESKQEPAVMINGKKVAWNPDYEGPYSGEFYARPVPEKLLKQNIVEADISAINHLLDGLENLHRNSRDDYDRGYIKAMIKNINAILIPPKYEPKP